MKPVFHRNQKPIEGSFIERPNRREAAGSFSPNDETDSEFGTALGEAAANGVGVWAYTCSVTPEGICLDRRIPVVL